MFGDIYAFVDFIGPFVSFRDASKGPLAATRRTEMETRTACEIMTEPRSLSRLSLSTVYVFLILSFWCEKIALFAN